jgi:hypothetical protein
VPARSQVGFLRDFLESFFESQFINGLITGDEYHDFVAGLQTLKLQHLSRELFAAAPDSVDVNGMGRLRLIHLREPDAQTFPFVQGLIGGQVRRQRKHLSCFVGHRFLANIEKSLRFNLRHLLEPYEVDLRWSGYDLTSTDLFDDIVTGIRTADFCLFDNLGTLNRPNVYIEIGIAYTYGIPMIVCEYAGGRFRGKEKVPDTESVPSDLQGLLRIRYRSYEDLCRQLYFGLPAFFRRHQFRA